MPPALLQSYGEQGLEAGSLVFPTVRAVDLIMSLIRLALGSIPGKCQALFWLSDISTSTNCDPSCLVGVTLEYQQKLGGWVLNIFDAQCLIFIFIQIQWKGQFRENEQLSYGHNGERGLGAIIPFERRSAALFPLERSMRLGWSTSCHQEIPVGVWGSEIGGNVCSQLSVISPRPLWSNGDESQWVTLGNGAECCFQLMGKEKGIYLLSPISGWLKPVGGWVGMNSSLELTGVGVGKAPRQSLSLLQLEALRPADTGLVSTLRAWHWQLERSDC